MEFSYYTEQDSKGRTRLFALLPNERTIPLMGFANWEEVVRLRDFLNTLSPFEPEIPEAILKAFEE